MNSSIDRKTAQRVILTLRSGTTSSVSARETTVGTEKIMKSLHSVVQSLLDGGGSGELAVVSADWGFGKSHIRTLLSSHLRSRRIPCIHDCVDGRGTSLAHIHRAVARWLEHVQIGGTTGLQDTVQANPILQQRALNWALTHQCVFATGLCAAIRHPSWGWQLALGHNYRWPDYPYNHTKAIELFLSFATFVRDSGYGGVVLLLDEAENVDRQWDIRGRRKSYETLARFAAHPSILPVLFVTDRFFHQLTADRERAHNEGWYRWSAVTRKLMQGFENRSLLQPPKLDEKAAHCLLQRICEIYGTAYGAIPRQFSPEVVMSHWQRAQPRSIRLLVRLVVNELDLAMEVAPLPAVRPIVGDALQAPNGRCPKCGRPLQKKKGPLRYFLGCSGFPSCRFSQDLRD